MMAARLRVVCDEREAEPAQHPAGEFPLTEPVVLVHSHDEVWSASR
jgi:hypothetical protein